MTEFKFYESVANCDFSTEVVDYAKEKYTKMATAKTERANAQEEFYNALNAKIQAVLSNGQKLTSKAIFEAINDDSITQGKITYALNHFDFYVSEKDEKAKAKTYFLI